MTFVPEHPYGTRERKTRYLRDPVPIRLGNLASTLARISAYAARPDGRATVQNMLAEAVHFIEWTGPDVEDDHQSELARMQVELARWRLRWPIIEAAAQGEALSARARALSDKVLEWSGLLSA
jgi:hypothetical protein